MRVPLRVLIVEDLPEQAELVAHELTKGGFALASWIASDLAGCRSAIAQGLDLVVADCSRVEVDLPGLMALLGGLEDPPPVVGLSTDDSEEVARDCLRNGASAFLHKFRLDELGGLVRDLVESRGARRAAAVRRAPVDSRSFAESACDLIAEVSSDGRLLYVNPSVEASLGYTRDELTGRRAFEIVHPDDLPGVLESLREAVETGSASRAIHRVRHRDGSWRWLESTANPYRDAQGERRVVAISRDVTERMGGDRELREVAPEPTPEPVPRQDWRPGDLGPLLEEITNGLDELLTGVAVGAASVERQLDPSSWLRRDMDRLMTSLDRGAALVRQLRELCRGLSTELPISDAPEPAPEVSRPRPKESQPIPKESQPTPKEPQPTPKEPHPIREETGPETILLVESEDRLRSVIRQTLEEEGYAVLEAASGEEALEKAANRSGPIHLMLSELVLPDLDGRELAKRVAASRPRARVILMSDLPDDGAESLPEGVRRPAVLTKPFTLAALLAKLCETIGEDPDRLDSR